MEGLRGDVRVFMLPGPWRRSSWTRPAVIGRGIAWLQQGCCGGVTRS